jgi:hypothetical protein
MRPENKQILDSLEHFHTTFIRNQTIQGLTVQNKADLLKVMREEFWPGYTYDEWCGECVGRFITIIYRKYNEWKEVHVEPVKDVPKVKMKATFPKNKMN